MNVVTHSSSPFLEFGSRYVRAGLGPSEPVAERDAKGNRRRELAIAAAHKAEFVPVLIANLRSQKQVAGQLHRYAAPELHDPDGTGRIARAGDVNADDVLDGGVNPE